MILFVQDVVSALGAPITAEELRLLPLCNTQNIPYYVRDAQGELRKRTEEELRSIFEADQRAIAAAAYIASDASELIDAGNFTKLYLQKENLL